MIFQEQLEIAKRTIEIKEDDLQRKKLKIKEFKSERKRLILEKEEIFTANKKLTTNIHLTNFEILGVKKDY